MSSLLRKDRRENQRKDTIECCSCGAVVDLAAAREYMDQDGRLCENCFEKELNRLCRDATGLERPTFRRRS